MIYPNYDYIDIAIGNVNKRNNIQSASRYKFPKDKSDCYRTWFRFPEEYNHHFGKMKTVKGYNGKCYCDFIPIDIDNTDLNISWEQTRQFIETLRIDFEFEPLHIFFSGHKGFHIYLPAVAFSNMVPSEKLNRIAKNIVFDIADGLDLDPSIYDKNRLFRITNTINSKSGLYKIPLVYNQFSKGVDFILSLAREPQKNPHPDITDYVKNIQFVELYEKHKAEFKTEKLTDILANGVSEGERDNSCARIAGLIRKEGMSKNLAYTILLGWNKGNKPPLDDSEIEKTVESIYRYPTNNGAEDIEANIKPIWALSDEYSQYVTSTKKVNLGISLVDQKIRGLRPGQVLTILGFTGNFKSALLQWILRHYCKYSKEPIILFEMEMSNLDLFERAVQMTIEKSGKEIENIYKNGNGSVEISDLVKEDMENFLVIDRPGLNLSDMKQYVEMAESILKKKMGLVGIDFIQLMSGEGESNVQKVDAIAKAIKNFAKDLNIPVIAVSQVTGVDDEYEKIGLMGARDSKTIAQMGDYVLGIRLKKNTEDIQIIEILKNRKGGKGSIELKIDRKSLRFSEMEYGGKLEELPF